MRKKVPPEAARLLRFALSDGRADNGEDLFRADAALQRALRVSGKRKRAVTLHTKNAVQDVRAVVTTVEHDVAAAQRRGWLGEHHAVASGREKRRHAAAGDLQRQRVRGLQQRAVVLH